MMRTFILRVLLALVVGLGIALWMAQRDPRFLHAAQERLTGMIERMLDCKLSGTLVSLNLFNPTIVIKHAAASSKQPGQWQWECERCTFQFSYLELLTTGKLALQMRLENLKASSLYADGQLPITEHLARLVAYQKELPLALKKLLITNGHFVAHTLDKDNTLSLAFKSEAGTHNNRFKASMYITDGSATLQGHEVATSLAGSLGLDMKKDKDAQVTAFIDMQTTLPQLPEDDQRCSLRATWKDRHGKIWLCNKQGTFAIKQGDISVSSTGKIRADARAVFPLSYWYAVYAGGTSPDDIHGVCTVTAQLTEAQKLQASLRVEGCGWRSFGIDHLQCEIKRADGTWDTLLHVHDALLGKLQGTGTWDEKKQKGNLALKNNTRMRFAPFRYWTVAPHDISVQAVIDSSGVTGAFGAKAQHEKLDTDVWVRGALRIKDTDFLVTGSVNDKPFEVALDLAPTVRVRKVVFTDQEGKGLIGIKTGDDEHTTVQGTLTFPFLRLLLLNSMGYDIQGQGNLHVKGALKDQVVYGQLVLPDGNIRLASTYNFVQQARIPLRLDLARRHCTLTGAHINLHKGTIACQKGTVQYNDQATITFAHIPLLLNKVFLNVGKDMFAVVSGYVVLEQRPHAIPVLRGTIMIDRAQLKRNILSGNVQSSLLRELGNALVGSDADLAFDVRVVNRHPLRVRTTFLRTDLDLELHATGKLSAPRVSGSINLSNGTLHFPYRSLHIVNGSLHFQPHQPDDPRIEFMAKGTIKRYTITLQVGGTVRYPSIHFSSSPSLDEEQIITLLLAGSKEGSLSLVMPSLIMQNVQNLIFGSDHGASTVDTYVNNVLAPFKHIRIVPGFSDQTARGGFRGSIEIDVSDRLHALVQKNFTLTEDTVVEVEYRLSDDITVRGLKDERFDVGAELEAKFSF